MDLQDELVTLEALVGGIPNYEPVEVVTTSRSGAGFGNVADDVYVEEAAMDAVTEFYEKAGWVVEDVSAEKLGWDRTCSLGSQLCRG